MRSKNLTPFLFGTGITSTVPPKPEMVLVVRGRFDLIHNGTAQLPKGDPQLAVLAQGALTGDVLQDPEDDRSALAYASDFAPLKPRAELLFSGSCHTPRGKLLKECPVRIDVGSWHKELRILGDREWVGLNKSKPSDAQGFSTMPLDWTRSFGGPDCGSNPVGLGPLQKPANIEDPKHPILSASETYTPAGFAAINAAWQPRKDKLGSRYGAEYRKRAPYFASDFDWSYFNVAPTDQQIPSAWRGDETIKLQNLNARIPLFESQLPGLRPRCFVHDRLGHFREVSMVLDTVFIDGDNEQVLLTWRGRTEVQDDECEDVTTVLIASELLEEEPAPLAHYKERLLRFEANPLALEENLTQEQLDTLGKEHHALLEAGDDKEKRLAAVQQLLEKEDPNLQARLGPGVDLQAELQKALRSDNDTPPPVPHPENPRAHLSLALREVEKVLPKLEQLDPQTAQLLKDKLNDPKLRALDPNYCPPGTAPASRPALEPGADLSNQDFSGEDLRGVDLSGANLSGAILNKVQLNGSRLQGANLSGAVLFKADLSDADLRGANLDRCNAGESIMRNCNLEGANLEAAFFGKADCQLASFSSCRGRYVFFTEAQLAGANFRECELHHGDFEAAHLERAVFESARLSRCLFYRSMAKEANFEKAELQGCSFSLAQLDQVNMVESSGETCDFSEAKLSGADVRFASFPNCLWMRVEATGVRFDCADLSGCRFFKSQLDKASFQKAKLVGSDFSKSTISHSSFRGANLFDAKLFKTKGKGVDLSEANIMRAVYDQP